ncbi:hypothetical protein ACFL6O_02685 [candidate division KSB1 bacterium]
MIERGHIGFRRAKFCKNPPGVFEPIMVSKGRAVAPCLSERLFCRFCGSFFAAGVQFDLREDIESVRVKQRIWTPLGIFPYFPEPLPCFFRLLLPAAEFRQHCQDGKFLFNKLHPPGACQGKMQPLAGGIEIAEAERRASLQPGGADEVPFKSLDVRQFPGTVRKFLRCRRISLP